MAAVSPGFGVNEICWGGLEMDLYEITSAICDRAAGERADTGEASGAVK